MVGSGDAEVAEYAVMSPTGNRISVAASGERAGFITLVEQGLYEVHDSNAADGRPLMVAVNVDLAESDLAAVDPEELGSMVTGRAGGSREVESGMVRSVAPDDLERRQSIWWYLLMVAAVLFVAETLVSNRLSRTALSAE